MFIGKEFDQEIDGISQAGEILNRTEQNIQTEEGGTIAPVIQSAENGRAIASADRMDIDHPTRH